jgi:hypothetical protein
VYFKIFEYFLNGGKIKDGVKVMEEGKWCWKRIGEE